MGGESLMVTLQEEVLQSVYTHYPFEDINEQNFTHTFIPARAELQNPNSRTSQIGSCYKHAHQVRHTLQTCWLPTQPYSKCSGCNRKCGGSIQVMNIFWIKPAVFYKTACKNKQDKLTNFHLKSKAFTIYSKQNGYSSHTTVKVVLVCFFFFPHSKPTC